MTTIEHDFLITGQEWDSSEIEDLQFNFATETPFSWYTNTAFLSNYEYIGDDGLEFSGLSNPSSYDQKDVTRFFLIDPADLDDFTGNDTVNSVLVNTANTSISGGGTENYRVSFADVITAGFSEDTGGEIQLVNHQGNTSGTQSLANLPDAITGAGDIVINDLDPLYDDLEPGQGGFWLLLHELGHAIGGLDDVSNTSESGEYVDSMKYTMMSYNTYGDTYASGLQLLDIAALQDTYGTTNTNTRSSDTVYKLGQGLGFYGASANDAFLYTIWDGGGTDEIDASDFNVGAEIDLREGHFSSIGKDGNGTAWTIDAAATLSDPDPGNVAIAYGTVIENATGTNYVDFIYGNEESNILYGLSGNDTLEGNGGNDTLYGGNDNDILYGGGGNDTLYGEAGDDHIEFDINDTNYVSYADGGTGTDLFSISNSLSPGYKSPGSSDLILNDGTITSSIGIAENFEGMKLDGSAYKYIETLGWTFDIENSSTNFMDYSAISQSLEFDIDGSTSWSVTETVGMSPSSDTYINIGNFGSNAIFGPHFVGTNYGDHFTFDNVEFHDATSSTNPILELGTGDDTVDVYMDTGNDSILEFVYTDGDDTINFIGTAAFNVAYQGEIWMAPGIDSSDISFTKNNVTLILTGASYKTYSFDLVVSISGKGSITIDDLAYRQSKGSDNIYDTSDDFYRHLMPEIHTADGGLFETTGTTSEPGSGNLEYIGGGALVYKGTAQDDTLSGDSSGNSLYGYGGDDTINGGGGVDYLYGYGGDDTLSGDAGSDWIFGGLGNDTLNGNDDDDRLYGNQGEDILNGGAGDDILYGENDDDSLYGKEGDDDLYGGFGDDTLRGEDDDDTLYGEGGNDDARGGNGVDTIYGGDGSDRLEGNAGNDTLYGGDGDDNNIAGVIAGGLFGGDGNDTLYGDAGDDRLYGEDDHDGLLGGAGNDALRGGSGNDNLYGDAGNDNLWGDAGADTFIWLAADVGNGIDDIKDFNIGDGDKLDVSDILDGNYDPMSDSITDFIQITDDGTHSRLYSDADGGADNFIYVSLIRNITGLTDESALETSGTLITV